MSLELYLPFMESLKSYNECVNIYSKSAYDRLGFHIQDSLILAALIAHGNERVVDFGSGAGFPSFFIAHQNPSIITVSVESKEKKRIFLRQLKEEYALSNWHIFDGDIKQFLDHNRKPIDCLTAKAFGSVSKIKSLISIQVFFSNLLSSSLEKLRSLSGIPSISLLKSRSPLSMSVPRAAILYSISSMPDYDIIGCLIGFNSFCSIPSSS